MIITLCGSSRFERWYHLWNEALGLAGHACFGLCAWPSMHSSREWYSGPQKERLDLVHFQKIEASEAILVLNVMAYVGDSTIREIEHAAKLGKRIYLLESWGKGCGIGPNHAREMRLAAERFGVVGGSRIDAVEGYPSPGEGRGYLQYYPFGLFGPGGPDRSSLVEMIKEGERAALLAGPPNPIESKP
jgi:hypothetical protein